MIFSDTISGLPDKVISFGPFDNEYSRNTVDFNQEVIGIYFIPNLTPDFEGISFLLEDGSYLRIGEDEPYTPSLADHSMLSSRFIGLSVKFYEDYTTSFLAPSMMGIITDSTNCETAQFSALSFSSMIVDVYTGATVTYTETVQLSTVWGEVCSYTLATSPGETWLAESTPSSTSIQFDAQSTDLSLTGVTFVITVTLTPII